MKTINYNMVNSFTKIELKAIPRKLSLLDTLAFFALGIGSIVLTEKSVGTVPCDRAADNKKPI